jgi:hypothetical protein
MVQGSGCAMLLQLLFNDEPMKSCADGCAAMILAGGGAVSARRTSTKNLQNKIH